MKAILKRPKKRAEIIDIEGSIEELQKLIGGFIESLRVLDGNVCALFDEEGLLKNLEPNIKLEFYTIVGNVLFVGILDEEFISLNSEQEKNLLNILEEI